MKIVKNGKIAVIVTSDKPAVNNAKDNLLKYLIKCLNVTESENATVKFILKISADENLLKYDGYKITVQNDTCTIISKEARGVLYGVYGFLERYLKVRFIAPDCEICPATESVTMDNCETVDNPSFALRGAYTGGTRLNKDYYSKLRNHHQFESTEPKYGGDVGWARIDGQTGHNTLCYVKPAEYFKKHPELFSVINGEVRDICFTSGVGENGERKREEPDCISIIAEDIVKRYEEDTSLKYFMIGQQDSWPGNEHECQCERCKKAREKYKSSGVVLRFMNLVSDEVDDLLKNKRLNRTFDLIFFAYSQTYEAPAIKENGIYRPIDETVVPRNGIYVWYCTTDENENMYYCFNDEKNNTLASENFSGWKSVTNNFMLWDYGVNFSEYNWYVPTKNSIVANIRTMKEVNCEYVLTLLGYSDVNEWQSLYKGYLASKVMWNTEVDENEILNEYFDLYYGVASPYVKKVIDLFEKHYKTIMTGKDLFIMRITKSDDYMFNANYYPLSLLDEAENLLEQALVKIKEKYGENETVYTHRVHAVMLTPLSMKLYNCMYYYKDVKVMNSIVERIKKYCAENGIHAISEGVDFSAIEWIVKMINECATHPIATWDLYRHIYDGFVGNYVLPRRIRNDENEK